jgi:hypothetical protein
MNETQQSGFVYEPGQRTAIFTVSRQKLASAVRQKFHDTYAAKAPLAILWGLGRGSRPLVIDPVLFGGRRQQRLGGIDADWRTA